MTDLSYDGQLFQLFMDSWGCTQMHYKQECSDIRQVSLIAVSAMPFMESCFNHYSVSTIVCRDCTHLHYKQDVLTKDRCLSQLFQPLFYFKHHMQGLHSVVMDTGMFCQGTWLVLGYFISRMQECSGKRQVTLRSDPVFDVSTR